MIGISLKVGLPILGLGLLAVAFACAAASPAPQPIEAPAHFVGRVFAVYADSSPWWRSSATSAGKHADALYRRQIYSRFYDPSLARLIQAGFRSGKLDYDPVCQCQDTGGVYAFASGAARGPTFFDAHVRDKEGARWALILSQASGSWRLYDVVGPDGLDLRHWLGRR